MAKIELVIESRRAKAGADQWTRSIKQVEKSTDRATKSVRRFDAANDKVNKGISQLQRGFAALGVTIGAGLFARSIVSSINTFQELQNRLKIVTNGTQDLANVTRDLAEISERTRSSLETNATLFSRISQATRALNLDRQELLTVTENLNKAVIISGASSIEASNALIQLSQGLASGALRGDELRSVLEQVPVIADVIARRLGVTRGELRKIGQEGAITARVVTDAFLDVGDSLDGFERTTATLAQGGVQLRNEWVLWGETLEDIVGGELDKLLKLAARVSKEFRGLIQGLDALAEARSLAVKGGAIEPEPKTTAQIVGEQRIAEAGRESRRRQAEAARQPEAIRAAKEARDLEAISVGVIPLGEPARPLPPTPKPFSIDASLSRGVERERELKRITKQVLENARAEEENQRAIKAANDEYERLQGSVGQGVLDFGEALQEQLTANAIAFNVAATVTNELGNALADIVLDAKSARDAFNQLGRAVVRELINIATQLIVVQAIKGAGGLGLLNFASGGDVSGPQSGFPVILHGTERVIPLNPVTKEPLRDTGGGGGGTTIVNNNVTNIDAIDTKSFEERFVDAAGTQSNRVSRIVAGEVQRDSEIREAMQS